MFFPVVSVNTLFLFMDYFNLKYFVKGGRKGRGRGKKKKGKGKDKKAEHRVFRAGKFSMIPKLWIHALWICQNL